jgi:hypothetical protein
MNDEYNPVIRPEHWCKLPVPFLEMQVRPVEVLTSDTNKLFEGDIYINRHPDDETLFSVVVILSDFPTSHWATHEQVRARIHPSYLENGLSRSRMDDGKFRYRLILPESHLSETPLPLQLRSH